jgi:hypothetical protein
MHLVTFCHSTLVFEVSTEFPTYVGNKSSLQCFHIRCLWIQTVVSIAVETIRETCTVPDRQVNAAFIPGVVVLSARRLLSLSIPVDSCLARVANFKCQEQQWNLWTHFPNAFFRVLHTLFVLMLMDFRYKSVIPDRASLLQSISLRISHCVRARNDFNYISIHNIEKHFR